MRTYILSAFLVAILMILHKQVFTQHSIIAITFSGKAGFTQGSSFGRMVKSYNEQNKDNEKKLKNFGPSTGWCLGVDWITNNIFMGYYQHQVFATATSKVNSYLTREFQMKQKAIGMDFGGGNINEKGGFVIFGGIYFSNINVSAGFKYRDGYRSLGNESIYNGIYHGFGVTAGAGLKGYRFKGPIGITYALRWYHIFSNISLDDQTKGTETLSEGWTNAGPAVTSKFYSVSLELGLAFQLNLL